MAETNLMAFHTPRFDGHGGHGLQHRQEMKEIAKEVVREELAIFEKAFDERIQRLLVVAYRQAIQDVLDALEYDIESVVEIGIDGCKDVFRDKKVQKFLSKQVMKELHKMLDNKDFRI